MNEASLDWVMGVAMVDDLVGWLDSLRNEVGGVKVVDDQRWNDGWGARGYHSI